MFQRCWGWWTVKRQVRKSGADLDYCHGREEYVWATISQARLEERLIHEHRQGQRHLAGPFSISICGENGNGASGWAAAILTTKTPESYELSRRAPEHDPFTACVRYSYIIITCLAILDQTGRIVFRLL